MAVYLPINITSVSEATEKPSKTYKLDLDNGRILGYVDGLESVNQAIRKILATPRFKCLIYDNKYGSETEAVVIKNNASRKYIESSLEGYVKDALSVDTRILSVSDFEIEFQDDNVYISFTAKTIFGETEIEEVI